MKQLEIRLDPSSYDGDRIINELVRAHSAEVSTLFDQCDTTNARKHIFALDKLVSGSNPVAPFVKACCQKSFGVTMTTKQAFAIYQCREKRGLERPLEFRQFQGKFRQAVDSLFATLPVKGSTSKFEGITCHDC